MAISVERVGGEFGVTSRLDSYGLIPSITTLPSGDFVVVWQGNGVEAQMFKADGTPLGSLIEIIPSGQSYPSQPQVTSLTSGGFVITWTNNKFQSASGDFTDIKAQVFDPSGAKVGGEFLVNSVTAGSQGAPRIASLRSGGFVVSWSDSSGEGGDSSGRAAKAQIFDSAGNKIGSEFLINTATLNNQSSAVITSLAGGGFVATWGDASGQGGDPDVGIKAQIFDQAGAKVGGEFLVNTLTNGIQTAPVVTELASGGFVIAWETRGGGLNDSDIKAQMFDAAGVKVGSEFLVNTTTQNVQTQPGITATPSGGFVITWYGNGGQGGDPDFGVQAQVFDSAGKKVGGEFLVNSITSSFQLSPTITSLHSGGFVVSWSDDSSGTPRVKAQIFQLRDIAATTGTDGQDTLTNNPNVDPETVDALAGDDIITIRAPSSSLTPSGAPYARANVLGGEGRDTLVVDAATGLFSGMSGVNNDGSLTIRTGPGSGYTVTWSSIERLELTGTLSAGGAAFVTGDSVDILRLSAGVASGYSILTNGGNDEIYLSNDTGTFTVFAGAGDDLIEFSSSATGATTLNIGFGGDGNDILRGSARSDQLDGGPGDDLLDGGDGADILYAGAGADTLLGGLGNDIFYFGGDLTGDDKVDGGEGNDTLVLQGNYANFTFLANSLTNIEGVSIQSGTIKRWGQSGTNSYDYNLKTVEANVAAGQQLRVNAQSLVAGEDFTFDGSGETDGGRFLVFAGYGVDLLTGGAGNDVFFFEAGRFGAADKVNGGAGTDAVVISGKEPSVAGAANVDIAPGTFTSIEALSFNGRFASDPNALPSYNVVLRDGNIADGARLVVNGSSLGSSQSLSFDASAVTTGSLTIFGGAGADTVVGGANDDLIYAARGRDTLTGGGGSDVFQFRDIGDSTVSAPDRVTDFVVSSDRIDLSFIDANSGVDGDQAFRSIGNAAFSKAAGELRYEFDAATNLWRVEGDVNGDGTPDFLINLGLTGSSSLTDASFIL